LKLGRLDDPSRLKGIQVRDFDIRISKTYAPVENADFLLVTNSKTEREELEAWEALVSQLGMKMAVWDLSYYGYLELTREMGENRPLIEENYKGAVVLLNNTFETDKGKIFAADLMAKRDFFAASNEKGIGFYLPGGNGREALKSYLIPELGDENGTFASTDELLEHAKESKESDQPYLGKNYFGPYALFYDSAEVSGWHTFGTPKDKDLAKEARATLKELEKIYPQKQIIAVYDHEPQKETMFLNRTWNFGRLMVRRVGGVGVGNAVTLDVPDQKIHSPSFIVSRENLVSLFSSMRFSSKLAYLKRLIKDCGPIDVTGESSLSEKAQQSKKGVYPPNPWSVCPVKSDSDVTEIPDRYRVDHGTVLNSLIDTMIADLAHEHLIMRKHTELSDAALSYEMWNLRKLTRLTTPTWVTASTPVGKALIRLATGIKFTLWSQQPFWRRWARKDKPYALSLVFLDRFIDVAMGGVSPPLLPDHQRVGSVMLKADANDEAKLYAPDWRVSENKRFRERIEAEFALTKHYSRTSYKPEGLGWISLESRREHSRDLMLHPLGAEKLTSIRDIYREMDRAIPIDLQRAEDGRDDYIKKRKAEFESEVQGDQGLLIESGGDQ
jgi:hypothetical protein